LSTNPERGFDEEVEGVGDGSLGRVFDRHDAIVGMSPGDVIENLGEIS
jgi:hypothetical protein